MSDSQLSAQRRAEIINELEAHFRREKAGAGLPREATAFLRDANEPDFFRYVDHMYAGHRQRLAGIRAIATAAAPLREGEHERSAVVGNPCGFHHRPACGLIHIASEHAVCEVHLVADGKSVRIWDPTTQTGSVLAVYMMTPRRGAKLTVRARGDGAAELAERMAQHITRYRDQELAPWRRR